MNKKLFPYLLFSLIFVISCGNNNENATAQNNQVQTSQTNTSTAKSGDHWYTDWNEGMAAAKNEKKPAVVDFYTDWCVYCKKMEKETFSDPAIKQRFSKDWITIRVNAEDSNKSGTIDGKTMTYPEMTKYFNISGFPTILFIDKDNKPVHPLPGFVPAEPFGYILDYFKSEEYKRNVNLNEYIKSKSKK